jgi:hypothetical protein
MYSTCLFCHGSLGRNDVIEAFPVGRRLAFDERKGRLWVVCGHCARWNLTPLEERWEAIEECERRFRATRLRTSTDNIGLARLPAGLDLIRIGEPLFPEMAAWRYGSRLRARRLRAGLAAGVGAVAAVAAAPMLAPAFGAVSLGGLVVGSVLGAPLMIAPGMILMDVKDTVQWERVVTRVRRDDGTVLTVRAKHAHASAFYLEGNDSALSLRLVHDGGADRLDGDPAMRTGARLLARANWLGAWRGLVRHAVSRIEALGDAPTFLMSTAERFSRFKGRRFFAPYRRIGVLNLAPVERLAFEMALHDQSERRALDGELDALADAWKEAEEIAAIADNLLIPESADDWFRRARG